MSDSREKIGLYGGTFDPVHNGHLIIAASVLEARGLDRVIFIPSARPPHKSRDIMYHASARLEMLERATEGDSRFSVSDIELKREGYSYTIDTIREMKASLSENTELFFIVGFDNLFEIELWRQPEDILGECFVLAATRVCDSGAEIPGWVRERVDIVEVPLIEISSSDIRARLREGRSVRYLVPDVLLPMLSSGK